MQNALNKPSYKETLAQIQDQISHWKEEVKKAGEPYYKAKAKLIQRNRKYGNDDNADYDQFHALNKKVDEARNALYEVESKLEERQEKQKKLLAEDKDYYGERAAHINERLSFRNEKLDKAREKYEKSLKKDQKLESNKKMTEKAYQEFQYIKDKVEGWNKQKEVFLGKGPDQYNYEKRVTLGEKNHHHIIEATTQDLVDYLDSKGKRQRIPSSRGGIGGHAELPIRELLPMEEVNEDEEIVNQNDPRNKIKSELRSRRRIEKNIENTDEDIRFTQEGTAQKIDKVLKAQAPKPGTLLPGEVIKIDQHGNAVLSFYGGDMDGLMYNRGNIGLKVGDKKIFMFQERSKRKGRYIFTFPPKQKKSESPVTEEAEKALV